MEFMKKLMAFGLLIELIAGKATSSVIDLTRDNWNLVLDGEWMVEIYASCSSACQHFELIWNDFSTHSTEFSIKVGRLNICHNSGLLKKLWITSLPMIFHISKGDFREYTGQRRMDEMISFIRNKSQITNKEIIATMKPTNQTTKPFAEIVAVGALIGLGLTLITNVDLHLNTKPELGKDWEKMLLKKRNKNKKRRQARRKSKKANEINAQVVI